MTVDNSPASSPHAPRTLGNNASPFQVPEGADSAAPIAADLNRSPAPPPELRSLRFGLAYVSVPIYRMVMRLLYGAGYHRKYQAVADLIPQGATVVDLCAGDCRLAEKLARRGTHYTGLDLNPRFVDWARRRGIEARLFDVSKEEIPAADVICIQSSLYQFIPNDEALVRRMIGSARQLVIISEPVVNLASSSGTLLSKFAVRATSVNGERFTRRHTFETLTRMLNNLEPRAELVERQRRDALFVLRKGAQPDDRT